MRSDPLVRQWKLIRHMLDYPTGVQIDELVNLTGAKTRTIYRDIEALNQADAA